VTVPNFITIARLLSVPLIIWLMIADRFVDATVLFIIAGISDAADGFIAKRFGAASELGAYLDPIADKALLVSVFVTLGFKGVLPAWLIVLAVSRDILIIGGLLLSYMLSNPMAVRPLWVSKANTTAQIILIALVLGDRSGATIFQPFLAATVLAVAALTVVSAAAYLVEWVRHMTGGTADQEGGAP
jgi:cardiolipin synthase